MVPRADIVAVEESTSLCDLVRAFREAQHSRLPLYRETLDDPVGLIHIKDVLSLVEIGPDGLLRWPDVPITKVRRDLSVRAALDAGARIAPEDADHAYASGAGHRRIWRHRRAGLDRGSGRGDRRRYRRRTRCRRGAAIAPLANGAFDADARLDLEDFKEETGIALAPSDPDEEVDTLGGLVVSLLGRVPQRGEIVPYPTGYEFEVLEADPRRVKRLRIRPASPATTAPDVR